MLTQFMNIEASINIKLKADGAIKANRPHKAAIAIETCPFISRSSNLDNIYLILSLSLSSISLLLLLLLEAELLLLSTVPIAPDDTV